MGLYQRHRPQTFKEVIGQATAVKTLKGFLKRKEIPRSILLAGPSGCGKTTLARIMAREMGCGPMDLEEINASESRGIDDVRDVGNRMWMAPLSGRCRVFIYDEAHNLTRRKGGDAQTAILKHLEEPPPHVYFMLCTTDPAELLQAIRTRCAKVECRLLLDGEVEKVVRDVLQKEQVQRSDNVVRQIVRAAEGSARQALVELEKVLGIEGEESQLEAVQPSKAKQQAFDFVRAILWAKGLKWVDVARVVKGIDEDPETVRRLILANATNELLKGESPRAFLILDYFQHPCQSGKAGFSDLVRSAFEVVMAGKNGK